MERIDVGGRLDEIDALYGLEGHEWTSAFELLAVRALPGGRAMLVYSIDPDPELLPARGEVYTTVDDALQEMWRRAR